MKQTIKSAVALLLTTIFLISCAGTTTAISKRNMSVENKMSASVFLEPLPPSERTIYVQARNTTDQAGFNIEEKLIGALRAKGYLIENDPTRANYVLQVNVLSVGEANPESREEMVSSGYGGAISGGAVGAATGALASGHSDAVVGGALAGAAAGVLINSAIKDVTYSVVTDVQISERASSIVSETSSSELKQGTSGSSTTTSTSKSDWKRYQTRVVSSANKANLKLDRAVPPLADGIATTVAGIF
jgi:hypothetical protein